MKGFLSGILKYLMHKETEGNQLLNSYFPIKKGLCIELSIEKTADPKWQPHQDKKTTTVVGSWPKNLYQPWRTIQLI